jgi:hypothetical protein
VLKRDRVIGVEACDEPGRFCTRLLSFEGGMLRVNAEPTGPNPELRVQILDAGGKPVEGYTFERCRPITGDDLDAPMAWEGRDGIGGDVSRDAAALHVTLRDMRLYAFRFGA